MINQFNSNQIIKIKYMINQDQQGFYQSDPHIVVLNKSIQFNNPQSLLSQNIHKKQLHITNQLKSPIHKQNSKYYNIINQNPFIHHHLRQQWINSISTKNKIIAYHSSKTQSSPINPSLQFDSVFQCGNLDLVLRVSSRQYQLYIRPDTNTLGYFQWFYFKVKNTEKDKLIKFKIMNFQKGNMLYNKGLKPYVQSKINQQQWEQINDKVTFQQSQNQKYMLIFTYRFLYTNDQVSFASQPPYSYKKLMQFIKSNQIIKPKFLCDSLLKFKVPKIQILPRSGKFHSVAIAIARQHPGQVVSSWTIQGFINQLIKMNIQDVYWIIIPMMNIDGVFLGNNRTGIIGIDMNRAWNMQQYCGINRQKMMPQVINLTNIIKQVKQKFGKKVKLFLDFHGHSNKQGIFTYGPPYKYEESQIYSEARLFPQLIAKKTNLFKMDQCGFNIPFDRKNVARSIFFYKYKIPFCYTLQSTFGLFNGSPLKVINFMNNGKQIAISAMEFLSYLARKNSKLQTNEIKQHKLLIQKIRLKQPNDLIYQDLDSQIQDEGLNENIKKKLMEKIQYNFDKQLHKSITFEKIIQSSNNCQNGIIKIPKLVKKIILPRYIQRKDSFQFLKKKKQDDNKSLYLKPLGKFIPKILHLKRIGYSKIGFHTESSESQLQRLMILSADKQNDTRDTQWSRNQKMIIKSHRPSQLMSQISKNKNNKIGSKMLIIHEI